MAQVLKAPAALPEDLGLLPSTHMTAKQSSVIPVLGNPIPSSVLYRYQTCNACGARHMEKNNHTHEVKM